MAREISPSAAASLTVACTVPGLFTFFCPALPNVGGADRSELKLGQAKAAAASLVLGAAGSAFARSPWPFLATLALVALIIWQYEAEHARKRGES
jgi:hypothetical protein